MPATVSKFSRPLAFIGLIFFSSLSLYAKTDTVKVYSEKMQKSIPNLIISPSEYDEEETYATVYLLHGAGADYTAWSGIADLQLFADTYKLLIVCPDAGVTSWYFDSPEDPQMQYETFVTEELITYVEKHYSTKQDRRFRAITGLSMGGHGALYLALRHQDLWSVAGSTSGGVDIRPFPRNWDIAKRLGAYADHPERWEENTVINMLYLLDGKSMNLIIDCGVDDFFYDANKRLHQKLEERNIPHDFIARPGAHNHKYWHNSIQYQMMYIANCFANNAN
ncbi:esterase [Echinicola pacifica]|uniref:Esterase n=1 Tax=Echinicola pacifica TaxID=346377 RepID=A0A918PRH0_9BACT|nr:alpha/beta hydrolase family protein [Echinicola pacifica]GGZ20297.1 esterase [Echinicola pacifica]